MKDATCSQSAVTYYRGLEAQLVFIIAATEAKRELNLVLAMGGLSVLRTLIRFEPNSAQDILDKMHY